MNDKPLLVGISNDAWAYSHLIRWFRYAKANSGCRLGLILISEDEKLIAELTEQFDKVEVYPPSADCRDFYNEVRLIAPVLFEEPCITCDIDADVWGDLSNLLADSTAEIGCVKNPGHFPDWDKMGEGRKEYNNGFLVLNYGSERAQAVQDAYATSMDEARDAMSNPRVSGSIGFNLLFYSGAVKCEEIPYCNSVIWWDSLALGDAKVIQWCNDKGQAKRLALEMEWVRGEEAL